MAKELAKLPGAMTRDLGYPEAEARRLITKYQITDGDGEALGVAPVGVAAMIDTTVTQYLQEIYITATYRKTKCLFVIR